MKLFVVSSDFSESSADMRLSNYGSMYDLVKAAKELWIKYISPPIILLDATPKNNSGFSFPKTVRLLSDIEENGYLEKDTVHNGGHNDQPAYAAAVLSQEFIVYVPNESIYDYAYKCMPSESKEKLKFPGTDAHNFKLVYPSTLGHTENVGGIYAKYLPKDCLRLTGKLTYGLAMRLGGLNEIHINQILSENEDRLSVNDAILIGNSLLISVSGEGFDPLVAYKKMLNIVQERTLVIPTRTFIEKLPELIAVPTKGVVKMIVNRYSEFKAFKDIVSADEKVH
jgi:hypothetical protein